MFKTIFIAFQVHRTLYKFSLQSSEWQKQKLQVNKRFYNLCTFTKGKIERGERDPPVFTRFCLFAFFCFGGGGHLFLLSIAIRQNNKNDGWGGWRRKCAKALIKKNINGDTVQCWNSQHPFLLNLSAFFMCKTGEGMNIEIQVNIVAHGKFSS